MKTFQDLELCQDVVRLLEATGTNITEEHMANNLYGKEDKHYFLDIDMAVLGASAEEYNLYTKRVREEYSFLSDEFYKNLRLKVSFVIFTYLSILLVAVKLYSISLIFGIKRIQSS